MLLFPPYQNWKKKKKKFKNLLNPKIRPPPPPPLQRLIDTNIVFLEIYFIFFPKRM